MERIRTVELATHHGERVRIAGWLHAIRRIGGLSFIVVRDGWGTAQVVVEGEAALASLGAASAGPESIITVEGVVVPAPVAPDGCELREAHIDVLTSVTDVLPVTLGKRELKAQQTTLLDHAVVLNRHPARRAILRLSAGIMRGFREALLERQFTEIQTPKIGAAATEGGANVFQLDYFGKPAYL
ncbi:MAG TPA: OB-fold nucleic acid binding domain-containing protein, partial [Ktedonobacterales bacterium]|nr:OB-fold nucleic acid binding domain-containing protein [Ktedonobacterales bacterium]